MSKKSGYILSALILSVLVLSVLVSAESSGFNQGFKNVWQGIIDVLETILSPILGSSEVGNLKSGEVLFIKALFFAVILAFVWSILEILPIFENNTWTVVIVSIAVSILSTRFLLTPGWIETILLPYSALGIAVASLVPLMIYFYFIEKAMQGDNRRVLRKAAWIFGAVVFFCLFITRVEEIGKVVPESQFNPAYVYLLTAIACLIFFFADKTIQGYFAAEKARGFTTLLQSKSRVQLAEEIEKQMERVSKGTLKVDSDSYRAIYKDLKDRADGLGPEAQALLKALPEPRRT